MANSKDFGEEPIVRYAWMTGKNEDIRRDIFTTEATPSCRDDGAHFRMRDGVEDGLFEVSS